MKKSLLVASVMLCTAATVTLAQAATYTFTVINTSLLSNPAYCNTINIKVKTNSGDVDTPGTKYLGPGVQETITTRDANYCTQIILSTTCNSNSTRPELTMSCSGATVAIRDPKTMERL